MATTIGTDDMSAPDTFTLQIVSPSVGFNGPISFPELPTDTTVKNLKGKIRERLLVMPEDENQRLIHRGRLLNRDDETMSELFGRETLRNAESQTLHLVLRPSTQDPPPTPSPQQNTSQQNDQTPSITPTAQTPSPQPFGVPAPPVSNFPPGWTRRVDDLQPQQESTQHPTTPTPPKVYILSSPSGPRALLVTDTSSYYTVPRPTPTIPPPHIHLTHTITTSQFAQPNHPHAAANHPHAQPHPAQLQPLVPLAPIGHHGNPAPAAAGALALQLAPHIWLVIRLIGFIWFFTSGSTSWWRWIMITGLSVIFFLANTGLVDWTPLRRHLEHLIPLAARPGGAAAAGPGAVAAPADGQQPPGQRGARRAAELDPEQIAQRLLEQRRLADSSWLMTQARRVERASLLFLASLWPGVGERHVAAREAENEARRLREEAVAAEREAERAEAVAEALREAEAEWETEGEGGDERGEQGEDAGTSDRAPAGEDSPGRESLRTRDELDGGGEEGLPRRASGQGEYESHERPLIDV